MIFWRAVEQIRAFNFALWERSGAVLKIIMFATGEFSLNYVDQVYLYTGEGLAYYDGMLAESESESVAL